MTPKEKLFIYKAWENKVVSDTTFMAQAVNNAISNALRKKGKQPVPLWKKKPKRMDRELAKENLALIKSINERYGNGWIDKVYRANNRKKAVM